jgi:plastocyanin
MRHLAAAGIVVALGTATTALVIGLNAAENAASKDEVNSVRHQVAADRRSASETARSQTHSLNRRLARLRADLAHLSTAQRASRRGLTSAQDRIANLRRAVSALRSAPSRSPSAASAGPGQPSGAAPAAPTAAATPRPPTTLNVSETEFKIQPASPTVNAGAVKIEVTNDGKLAHSLTVQGPDGKHELENNLRPGASGTLSVDLNQPGTYQWYCPISGHAKLGMKGTITVR